MEQAHARCFALSQLGGFNENGNREKQRYRFRYEYRA